MNISKLTYFLYDRVSECCELCIHYNVYYNGGCKVNATSSKSCLEGIEEFIQKNFYSEIERGNQQV